MRTIAQFMIFSLKYFFNIEYHVWGHVTTAIIMILYSLKMIPAFVANEFYEGALTIKEDINTIKEGLINNIRSLNV